MGPFPNFTQNTQWGKSINNDPNVERFRKAWKHAIELFGGQTVEEDLFDGN